jgi:hypothetical protein
VKLVKPLDVANNEVSDNAAAVARAETPRGTKRKRGEHPVDERRHLHSLSATSLSRAYVEPPAGVTRLLSTDGFFFNNSTVFDGSGAQSPNHSIADLPLSTTNGESTETPQTSYGGQVTTSVTGNGAAGPTEPVADLGNTFLPHMEWNTIDEGSEWPRHVEWNTIDLCTVWR